MADVHDGTETKVVSLFAQRLRSSAEERAAVLERERQWLQQQLDSLRVKAAADASRGWSVRRTVGA